MNHGLKVNGNILEITLPENIHIDKVIVNRQMFSQRQKVCESCKYHEKEGHEEPCVSCEVGNSNYVPSAEPERKKGKWIYGEKSGQDGWYCSECGGFIPWYYDFYGLDNIDFIEDFKTCPFCDSKMVSYTGADMREGEQE